MKWMKFLSTAAFAGAFLFCGNPLHAETLQDAVQTMLKTNPEVRSAAHNRLSRDQQVKEARADYLPKIDFSAGYGIEDIQEPDSDTLHPQIYTLSLRENVFAGFSTMNEVERQKDRVLSQAYTLQGTSENTALRTAHVYLNVLKEQELVKLAEENLQNHYRIADQIKMRSDSGVATKADSNQVAGRVSLAQANVVVTKTNLADAESNYQSVVGHLPENLEKPAPPDDIMPASLEEAQAKALEMHPTLKSANADLDAREQQYEVTKAPFLPVVDLEVDQNWQKEYTTSSNGTTADYNTLVALIRLRFNLFHGFGDEARRAETSELIGEAREIRNNTNRQVVESIRLSWMAYQAVLDRIKYLEQRVAFTTETENAYTKQFNIGNRSLLDVLDTEAEVINAKQALVEAQYDGLYSQYRILNGYGQLVKSFGLEWPEEAKVSDNKKVQETKSNT